MYPVSGADASFFSGRKTGVQSVRKPLGGGSVAVMFLQPRYFFAVPGIVSGRFQEKGQFPQNGMVDDVDEGLFSQGTLADGFMAVLEGGEGCHAVIQVDGAQAFQAQHGIKMFQYGIQPVDDIISGGIDMAGI